MIEFSSSSLTKDLEPKRLVYAAAGIPEYWVVNIKTSELAVFRDPQQGDYQSQQTLINGTISPAAFPDMEVPIAQLLGR